MLNFSKVFRRVEKELNRDSCDPIDRAIEKGDAKRTIELLKGVPEPQCWLKGMQSLTKALNLRKIHVVRALIQHGVDPGPCASNVLEWAVKEGDDVLAQLLIFKGVSRLK